MVVCSNCGSKNPEGSRFCANCGANLIGGGRTGDAQVAPTSTDRSAIPPKSADWRMSDPGPLPEPPRRRTWLWILLGVLGACLLVCLLVFVWANTIGEDVVRGFLATAEAEATRQAGS